MIFVVVVGVLRIWALIKGRAERVCVLFKEEIVEL